MLWTAGRPRRRQFAALDPLPDDVDAAGAGDDVDGLSFFADALSFVDDEPFAEAVSDAVADLRLSVR